MIVCISLISGYGNNIEICQEILGQDSRLEIVIKTLETL